MLTGSGLASIIKDPITLAEDAMDATRYPQIPGYFRIEVKALAFDTQGKTDSGMPCDLGSLCDPIFLGIVDFEDPNNSAGDSIDYKYYDQIYKGTDIDRVENINKVISYDVCNKNIRKANVRFRLMDYDPLRNDKIDNLNYFITGDKNKPAQSEDQSQWSAPITVKGHDKSFHTVTFQYRLYTIPASSCKPRATSFWSSITGKR